MFTKNCGNPATSDRDTVLLTLTIKCNRILSKQ